MTARRWITIAVSCVVLGAVALCHLAIRSSSTAPVAAVLSHWEATLTITNSQPQVTVEMSGKILSASRDVPASIPIFPRTTVFRDLQVNGEAVSPLRVGDWFVVEIPKRGPFVISAALDIKPDYDRGEHRLDMHCAPFVEPLLSIDSTTAWDVSVAGVVGRVVGAADAGTHGSLALGQRRDFTVRWQRPRPAVVRSGTATITPSIVWSVGDKMLSARSRLRVEATGGALSMLQIELGVGADNVYVRGGHVRDFRLANGVVDIFFKTPLSSATQVELSYSLPRPAGDLVVCRAPQPVDGRLTAGGWSMVVNDSQGVLLEHEVKGHRPVSDLDLPSEVLGMAAGKPIFFYESTLRDGFLTLDVVSSTPFPVVDTIADRADILCLVRPGGEEVTRVSYRIRNNRQQFLRLRLPHAAALLRVEVENHACPVVTDGADLLVPLVTSIQTLGGLVAFPVEIIYFRQGDPARPRDKRHVDLPELDGVPVAVVNVTVMCPRETELHSYVSTLRRVDRFTHVRQVRFVEQLNDLGYNYYQAGYEAYRQNDLEEAEAYLSSAVKLTGDSAYAGDARNLMWNIQVGRGDVAEDADREERAKMVRIQEGLSVQNPLIAQQQQALIDGGLANLREGDEELGLELLEEAKSLGSKLVQRGASSRRQSALGRTFESKLKVVQQDRATNEKLERELETLQREAAKIVQASAAADATPQQAQYFANALYEAAEEQGITVADAQNAAFGDVGNVEGGKKPVRVSSNARARRHQRKVNQKQASKVSKKSVGLRSSRGSLSERNDWLSRQVNTLKQAVQTVNQEPATGSQQPAIKQGNVTTAISAANNQVRQAEEEVDDIVDSLTVSDGDDVAMNDVAVSRRLVELEEWTSNSWLTMGQADEKLRARYANLEGRIDQAQLKVVKMEQARLSARNVLIDLNEVIGVEAYSDQKALTDFIGNNYVASVTNGISQYSIENGQLAVVNAFNNPTVLNDVVSNLRDNGGQVVTVAGRAISTAALTNVSGSAGWFTNSTSDGRPYAVIDEAQYRALANGAVMLDPNEVSSYQQQRDVVVGTPNWVAGQKFKLESSDGLVNTMDIGGTEVSLPVARYAVVNNGDSLSVIKAGEVRGWQEKALRPVEVAMAERFDIELPLVGVVLRFEKTLLEAGESPDIDVQL